LGRAGTLRRLSDAGRLQVHARAVFLFGFAKDERDNIGADDLLSLREIAAGWLAADAKRIALALDDGALQEVSNDEADDT
jgi:hypothetical protein